VRGLRGPLGGPGALCGLPGAAAGAAAGTEGGVTCEFRDGMVLCRGPRTRAEPTVYQRSAGYCTGCRKRRVQTLIAHVPIEPSYYGPHFTWRCPCGKDMSAPGWEEA
jgi:hypothetical protein